MNPGTGHIFDGEEIEKVLNKNMSEQMKNMDSLVKQISDREKEIYSNIDNLKPFSNGEVVEIKVCYFRIISIDAPHGQIKLQGIPRP